MEAYTGHITAIALIAYTGIVFAVGYAKGKFAGRKEIMGIVGDDVRIPRVWRIPKWRSKPAPADNRPRTFPKTGIARTVPIIQTPEESGVFFVVFSLHPDAGSVIFETSAPSRMKTLKFRETLSRLVLSGDKDTTWRLFDDKNLQAGDRATFAVWETGEPFAVAEIIAVRETTFAGLTDDDWNGHEKFVSDAEMYATYSKYYGRPVEPGSPVKILKFRLRTP